MPLNWINPSEYSFNSFLLMERFQLKLMLECGGWRSDKATWRQSMRLALKANPAVRWYIERRCPECTQIVRQLAENAPDGAGARQIRDAEIYALASVEDFVIYSTP